MGLGVRGAGSMVACIDAGACCRRLWRWVFDPIWFGGLYGGAGGECRADHAAGGANLYVISIGGKDDAWARCRAGVVLSCADAGDVLALLYIFPRYRALHPFQMVRLT